MALFLSEREKDSLRTGERDSFCSDLYWALIRRAEQRASKPGLLSSDDSVDWWRPVGEYLSDAAMAYAVKPSETLSVWIRDVSLSLVRRPFQDWIGPAYRAHDPSKGEAGQVGHLETAHMSWALSVVMDLATEVFTQEERSEVEQVVRDRGVALCLRWLETPQKVANWRLVMIAGVSVAAAVLNDRKLIDRAVAELKIGMQCFQPDGSYGESLQYGSYAIYAAALSHEALRRRDPLLTDAVPVSSYAGYARWAAYSHLYMKPLSGWDGIRPRAINFNDSGAMFKPHGDVLCHIAARAMGEAPRDAGLARWLFERTYRDGFSYGPHDQGSFGLLNDFGFLTLALYSQAAPAQSPEQADLPRLGLFSCGDVIARDEWSGKTVLGFHGFADPLYGPGHLHGDINSIILAHNNERLLVDPGHSCYRNLSRQLEIGTLTHNTCSFTVSETVRESAHAEETARVRQIEQSLDSDRRVREGTPDVPYDRGGRRLLAEHHGLVAVAAGDAAALYGSPIDRFTRFVVLCGAHAVFVVDWITSSVPVTTRWSWLLNNRDGELDFKHAGNDRLVARRGNAGLKLFHLGGGQPVNTTYSYVHDAYHCLPAHRGENSSGSGVLVGWREKHATTERLVVHAMAVDSYGEIASWHLHEQEGAAAVLEGPAGRERWKLSVEHDPLKLTVEEQTAQSTYTIGVSDGMWRLWEA
ncbi:MAG: heparinase [Spirochaetaceae bacterium]|nr:MAG: heparinase [Spirochaetaceae bacterium]